MRGESHRFHFQGGAQLFQDVVTPPHTVMETEVCTDRQMDTDYLKMSTLKHMCFATKALRTYPAFPYPGPLPSQVPG